MSRPNSLYGVPFRQCSSCGHDSCYWEGEAWTCDRCGDEWYEDHGREYAAPTDDNCSQSGAYWSDPTPNERWEVTEGRDVSEPLPSSAFPS